MEKSIFICPVCGKHLMRDSKTYVCPGRHCFDISAKGYVNLLTADRKNSHDPGDNKQMVNARTRFLEKGYYSHLAEAVRAASAEYYGGGNALDAGCGEGYYTEKIFRELSGLGCRCAGAVDISKAACAKAGKRLSALSGTAETSGLAWCETAAASVFRLPVRDGSVSIITSMFAPLCREEFYRVLGRNGVLIIAIPGISHLFCLKEKIYDEPYENAVGDYALEGFELREVRKISREIFIDDPEDIRSLFAMTPYYYKTGKEGHERVNALKNLSDTAAFEVIIYRKISGEI